MKSAKWVWVFVFGFIASMSIFPIQSEDVFMYLAIARKYFELGHFPEIDPFLYPIAESWTILHQWLSYLVFYGVYLLGGYSGLIFLKVLFIFLSLIISYVWARKDVNAMFFWAGSVLLGAFAMSFRWMERTSLFSEFLFVAVLAILLAENKKPSRWKYLLPLIFLAWVNLHPAFPVGWALCGIALLVNIKKFRSKSFLQLAGLSLLSFAICFLNPKGMDGVLYPFVFSQNEGAVFRKLYFEWYPTLDPLFFWNAQSAFIIALILLNLFLLYKNRYQKPLFETAMSFFVILYGLYAIRFVPTMCYALILVNTVLALRVRWPQWLPRANFVVMALALALGLKNIFWGYDFISGHRDFGLGLDEKILPVKAARLIQQSQFQGNVFNAHMFGGYLAWSWQGKPAVFYHGFVTDTNFYLNEYVQFFRGREQFEAQVQKYQIKLFILDRFAGGEPLIRILSEHPEWKLAYIDDASLIFLPKSGAPF